MAQAQNGLKEHTAELVKFHKTWNTPEVQEVHFATCLDYISILIIIGQSQKGLLQSLSALMSSALLLVGAKRHMLRLR